MKIDVDKLIEYCEKCADVSKDIHSRVMSNIGHGESTESAIGACAYFMQRENMFRYEIPHIVKEFAENETPFLITPKTTLKKSKSKKIVNDLIELGYPHNFQLENSWVVDYCYKVSDIIEKAVELKPYLEKEEI